MSAISVSGQVRAHDQTPLQTIQVTAYRQRKMLDRVYTDGNGRYEVSVPAGEPISVRFDTHATITNAREWHPSVVANLDAGKNVSLDRILMRVGTVASEEAAADALAAYQFVAMWRDTDKTYAENAAARLGMLKVASELQDFHRRIQEHFMHQAATS